MRRFVVAVLALGCVAEFPPPSTGAGSLGTGGTVAATSGMDDSVSTTTATTDLSTSAEATTAGSIGELSADVTGDPPDGAANGEACMNDSECQSGVCFVAGILGGICGECQVDADCDWGCNPANPVSSPPMGSYCTDGSIGSGCQTSEACQAGLLCGPVFDIPGVILVSTCGECIDDIECSGMRVCSPDVDIANLGGEWRCIEEGSKPLGGTCALDGSGDAECATEICAAADIMGLVQVGVCSECASDMDCAGVTCTTPMIDLDGTITPGLCS